jgi:hypothetical protein
LPCLEYEAKCVLSIQSMAVSSSPLLVAVDGKLSEMQEAIDTAVVASTESEKMAILKPALLYFATPETVAIVENGQSRSEQRGLLDRLVDVVASPGRLVNEVVGAIAKPLADSLTGGSSEIRQSNIAIAGLNAELSNLRIDRQKLELEIRKIIDDRLAAVDVAARSYRLSLSDLAVEKRKADLYRLSFARGLGDISQMIALESAIDSKAGSAIAAFTQLRTEVNRLKFLAYGGVEIEE